jgi:predicted aldo/keto reductase-like oxidoreductase
MKYRTIGKTGFKAGVIGLGCEGLLNKNAGEVEKMVNTALDGGINMIDFFSPQKEARSNLGKALKGRRDKVFIQGHIGSVDKARLRLYRLRKLRKALSVLGSGNQKYEKGGGGFRDIILQNCLPIMDNHLPKDAAVPHLP